MANLDFDLGVLERQLHQARQNAIQAELAAAGLQEIGPVGSFAEFSPLSKVVLSVTMIAGRLELFPILVLFSRRTWSRS